MNMKMYLLLASMIAVSVMPAHAARKVYLKDGGVITARSVWRSHGRVHVLVNRDTLTEFSVSEVNIRRTFPHRPRVIQKQTQTAAVTSVTTPSPATPASDKKQGTRTLSLPDMPNLAEKKPENLLPSGGSGGTIKQHKKEMVEKAGE